MLYILTEIGVVYQVVLSFRRLKHKQRTYLVIKIKKYKVMKKAIVVMMYMGSTLAVQAQTTTQRNGLSEEFGSAHCPPCKTFFDNYHPALISINANDTAAHVNAICYQMFYPGTDPSYNLHARQRYDYYTVTGIPDLKINGRSIYTAGTQQQYYTALDTSRIEPAEIKISGSYIINPQTNTMDIVVNVTPLTSIKKSLKVHVAVLEHHYVYTGNTINQPDYYFVMRRMFPDGNGITESSWVANTQKNYVYNQTFAVNNPPAYGSFDFWGNPVMSDLLVFVQDSATRKIYQSQIIKASLPTTSIDSPEPEQGVACFPNPAKGIIYLGIMADKTEKYQISAYSIDGKQIYTSPDYVLQAGKHSIQIDVLNWPNGAYTLQIQNGRNRIVKRAFITH